MIPVAPIVQVADATTRPAAKAAPAPKPAPAEPESSEAPSNEPVLVQAKSKMDAGKLLEARKLLNDALNSGKLSDTDVRSAKQMMSEINQTVVFSSKKFADDAFGGTYNVKPGQRLSTIAAEHDITWEFLARLNGISDPSKMKAGANLKVITGPFHAVVDKSDYTMDLYLGGTPGDTSAMFVTTFRVGLGSDDSTPTGVWMVEPQKKLKNPTYYSPRGEGVIAADDPKNPLGEFWIGLTGIGGHAVGKASYGIHGTIEPDSIGKMESLGCVRMLNEDVERVYEMAVEGKSTVVVKE
jgi:lipoprotein-anchoring transpeptidase ErfK/SrfK